MHVFFGIIFDASGLEAQTEQNKQFGADADIYTVNN